MPGNPTTRFTSRVEDYVQFRPGYPSEVFSLLRERCGLAVGTRVADVGSGTGILTERLLEAGAEVFAIEPNAAMRKAAEEFLGDQSGFHSVDATAEATGFPNGSIDLVVAAQAFHWFDRDSARHEFARILRSGGQVALIWNERIEDATPFLRGYERLLREHSEDYLRVRHNAIDSDSLKHWFGGAMRTATFQNGQRFDHDGVLGRLMSSSYAPQAGDPRHAPMVAALRRLFDETSEDGTVEFAYETNVYYGPLA